MQMISVGPVAGGPDQLRGELRTAIRSMSAPKLVLLFLPIDADHAAMVAAASQATGLPVVGATTGGAAFTERGATRSDAVAAILGGTDVVFEVAVARNLKESALATVATAGEALTVGARRHPALAPCVLTLCDAFACDGEALLEALRRATPPNWRHFGGTAGDDWRFEKSFVFAEGEVLSNAAVFVGIFGATPPSLAAQHGWSPAQGGRELLVTGIEGNVLHTLDQRPAADVYREELQRLGLMAEGDDLLPAMATHELGARTPFGSDLKIRAPLSIGDDGSVVLASTLEAGTSVVVMTATPDQLIDAAAKLAAEALRRIDGRIAGALVFDCAARLQLLGDRYGEQVRAFVGSGDFPCVGMTCYGEIARFGGSLEGFHNTTAAYAAW
jgi:hypothetical protein